MQQLTTRVDNIERKALVVKLTPVELLDSAVMRMLGVVTGLQGNGYHVTLLVMPLAGTMTHELQDCLKKCDIVRLPRATLYQQINEGASKRDANMATYKMLSRFTHHLFAYDHTYEILKRVNYKELPQENYDVVISVSDPKTSHLAVKKMIKQGLKYGNWLQYWGDPFTLDITNELFYPRWIKKKIERSLMDTADKVIYVSPLTLNAQKKLFKRDAGRMSCSVTPYLRTRVTEKLAGDKDYCIGYYGSYYKIARDITPFYNACCEMTDVKCNIVGNGDVTLKENQNITILPRGEVEQLENDTDLLVCIMNSRGTQIPGKIYHDASTNKAILIITDGDYSDDIQNFLSQFERYYFCKNTKEDIISAVGQIRRDQKKWQPCVAFSPTVIVKEMLVDTEE